MFTISLGINTAACTLIGRQIGNNNSDLAKKYMRSVLKFAFCIFLIEVLLLWSLNKKVFDIFTEEEHIRKIGHRIFPVVFLGMMLDFWQGSISGVIRGIGK